MTPYVQTQKQEPFDWNAFLQKDPLDHSLSEMLKAAQLAGNWTTCACGNQCDIIPRDSMGAPLDSRLNRLGDKFGVHVYRIYKNMNCFVKDGRKEGDLALANRARDIAADILQGIEARSSELIAEITAK